MNSCSKKALWLFCVLLPVTGMCPSPVAIAPLHTDDYMCLGAIRRN